MNSNLKESFFKTFMLSLIWITFLLTAFGSNRVVSINYLWAIILVALIIAVVFGVLYNALWNHFTLKPSLNVIIASLANTVASFSILFIIAQPMFLTVLKWLPVIIVLMLIIHTFAFHFYAKYECEKEAVALNEMLVNN